MRRSAGRGGVDSPGGDNSGGSSQSDQIETDVNIYTVKFSVRGDDLVIPENAVYKWSFGDGAEDEGRTPEHTYAEAGTYPVSVTITGTASDGTDVNYNFKTSVILKEVPREASNSYLYAEKNQENPLNYSFYTPLTFSGVPSESVTYEWQYDTTIAATPSEKNVFNHTYDIYGKTYKARVTAKTGELTSSADVTITIPKPEVNLVCSPQGLTVTCYPEITLDGEKVDIPMDFTWDCGDNGDKVITSGTEPKTCFYDESSSGEGENKKTITVTGKSDEVEGEITDTETVSISNILNVTPLECSVTSADHLTWRCSTFANIKNADGTDASGKLQYSWNFGETDQSTEQWEDASVGYSEKEHTYQKYQKNGVSSYDVQVKVKYTGTDGYEEVITLPVKKINIDAPTVKITNKPADGNNFVRTFEVGWDNNYIPAGDLTYIWDFGDDVRESGGSTIEHTYQDTGDYKVTVNVQSASNPELFNTSFIKPYTLLINVDGELNVPAGADAITKKEHEENPLIWDFKIDGVSSTTGEIVYQWKKDGQVIGTNSPELKDVKFDKFGETYSITVDVSIKNTNIKKTVTTSVITGKPSVKINMPSNIVTNQEVTFSNTITYKDKDVKHLLQSPVYSWVIDSAKLTGDTAKKSWAEQGAGKLASLTVTAGNMVGDIKAEEPFEVLPAQVFKEIKASCSTPDDKWNTIRHLCTGKAIAEDGSDFKDENNRFTYVWTAKDVNYTATVKNNEAAEVILNWPSENRANKTGENAKQSFNVRLQVYDRDQSNKEVFNGGVTLTVRRNIGYKANVRNYKAGQGKNIKNIIDITELKGPENATYQWRHQMNSKSRDSITTFTAPFATGKVSELNFVNLANEGGFIGKMSNNPLTGYNGIALRVSGGGLSKPVDIWGLDVADGGYQMFGPEIQWCDNSYAVRAPGYAEEMDRQLGTKIWGVNEDDSGRLGRPVYLWIDTITTVSQVSKDAGDFAKITVINGQAKSIANMGLKNVGTSNLKTTADTIKLAGTGQTISLSNGLVFYFNENYQYKAYGKIDVLLRVKDTSRGGGSNDWYDYGTCPTIYNYNGMLF